MVNRVTAEVAEEVNFLAIAGRSDLKRSEAAASQNLSDHVLWGYDEDLWEQLGIFGQPVTLLINADGTYAGDCDSPGSCTIRGFGGEDGVRENLSLLLG